MRPIRAPAGIIEGLSTVHGFNAVLARQDIGVDDYLEVDHEGAIYLCTIRNCQRNGSKLQADCVIVGQTPRTPFLQGSTIYRATEETVRSALELTGTIEAGLYIGSLRRLGLKVWFPVAKIGRVFIVGKPGSGKSYTVGVFVEELLKKSVPVVIIDPHGEYSSLKVEAEKPQDAEAFQPKSYIDQIIEFGDFDMNPGADLSLAALRVAQAEDLVLQGLCTTINLRGLGDDEQLQIVSYLLASLFEAAASGKIPPFYCVLDEAHRFAGKDKTDASMLVRRFAQEGRKFGANLIVVTQRPQLLDTTVRGLVGTWIIHRLTDPNDVKIAMESGGLEHRWEREITWFEKGEALVTGEIVEKIPLVVQVRRRETRHGAPGFNPLDFVTPEARARAAARIGEKKLKLIKREAESFEERPILAPGLPQCFASLGVTESVLRGKLSQLLPGVTARLGGARLEYFPTVQFHVCAKVTREDPRIAYNAELTGLASLADIHARIDWKQREVFGVAVSTLDEAVLTTKPSSPGRYVKIRIPLEDQNELNATLEGLRAYAALETTKVVYYHRSLGIFAVDTDQAVFLKECQRATTRFLETRSKELAAAMNAQLQDIETRVKHGEAEVRRLASDMKRVEAEAGELREQLRSAERAGRPTRRLEARVSARERKTAALKVSIAKAEREVQKAYKRRLEIREEKERELAAARAAAQGLEKEEVGREVVQPTAQELKVATIQVVWIPVYRAELTIAHQSREKTLAIAWNAVNGKGTFGLCGTCGHEIQELNAEWLCADCLSPLCSAHALACSRCGKTLCPDHALKCRSCGKVFCSFEKLTTCAACKGLTCADCGSRCMACGSGKVFCAKHLSRCHLCSNLLCAEHLDSHFVTCSVCSQRTCQESAKHCSICGDVLCASCIAFCSACGMPVCKAHSWTCPVCRRLQCEGEPANPCAICGRKVCSQDSAICPSCGQMTCTAHTVTCPNCGRRVCANCTVAYRRLLVKRTGCRLCVKAAGVQQLTEQSKLRPKAGN